MTLQDDALRLAELDQEMAQLVRDGKTEKLICALAEYVKLRSSVHHRMLDEDVISIEEARAREVLRRIAGGEGLEADDLVKALGEVTGNSDLAAFGVLGDAEIEDLGWDLFYSWYGPHEYVRGRSELRPLIPECGASPTVKRLVGEARQCYAFQQYDAATTMCRALLEAGVRDVCERLGLIRRSSKSYGDGWSRLLGKAMCTLGIEESFKKKLKRLYGDLCTVAHAERTATPRKVLTEFHETLSGLEELYENLAAYSRSK